MRSKSPLQSFAFAVLQALLTILPISALATAENDLEIGVPQFKEAPEVKGCFGAVLAPDGDHFYTVHEGVLTQYQIKPFKKQTEVALDWTQLNESQSQSTSRCRVLMTDDKSRLVVAFSHKIFLLDANTGRVVSKSESEVRGRGIVAVELNEGELVVLVHDGQSFLLSTWDANTLKPKREIGDFGKSLGRSAWLLVGMSKIRDRIFLATRESLVVLNRKTYAPELSLSYISDDHPKLSKDLKKLYVWRALKVTDQITGKHSTYDDAKRDRVLVFDQETRQYTLGNVSDVASAELYRYLVFVGGQIFHGKNIVMLSAPDLRKAMTRLTYIYSDVGLGFRQYESGEAILIGKDKYFQLTPGARKYLMMKTRTRMGDPINDATFAKFHKVEGWQ